ncbi:protein of unknown function [Nitrosomonas sp. Nm51]|uniref:DUF4381 domain-containing protein n=1 Tax=Nitrosomonas sp. Nm51 TaxID=133720 RepID=UPI0008BE09BC|nr:DUF4381 domain-containing protein [Nitrosomonas sp. Nm51]SER07059.1 protein of unknown function [Nitrosomonas sp. Nm51]
MMEDPLAALRPLHVPPPVSWWPPAPGWWIVVLLIAVCIILIYRYRKQRAAQRAALNELKWLANNQNSVDQPVARLNQLLKRYALTCWPAKKVAALTGQSWLDFLDTSGGKGRFSSGPGRLLLAGPYREAGTDLDELIDLARQWIKTNMPKK